MSASQLLFRGAIPPWCAWLAMAGALAADTNRIGLLLPPNESNAASILAGAGKAIATLNAAGAEQFELIVRGRAGQWGDDGIEAGRLALDDEVMGIIAPPDGAASHLALQVAGRTQVPVVSLCSDHSVAGAGIPWARQLAPDTLAQGRVIFRFLRAAKVSRWSVLVPEGRSGREAANDLASAAQEIGVARLLTACTIPASADDPAAVIESVREDSPEAILLWLPPSKAARYADVLRAMGYNGFMAGPATLRCPAFLEGAGGQAEQVYFVGRLEANAPDADDYDFTAALAHDAVMTIAGDRRDRAAPIAGDTGPIEFDQHGRRQSSWELLMVRRGKVVAARG
jgi:ABC-type branched-subunit amino acid transport system substrate-binding protein